MKHLPRNPYIRSPIKRRKDLPARQRELGEVRYYFDLLANGHTPHLALIGPRGVGKTSMLNACDAIARDLGLVPVRVDLDEGTAATSSQFWLRVYASLLESLAEAKCWGGAKGPIFRDTYHMLHLKEKLPADRAVLRIPYIHSQADAGLAGAFAIDREVTVDLGTCVAEARQCDRKGIVFLIDEADCLGLNLPLLQTLRNIFQASDGTAVVLAGTENVFPAIKEVFSPIPRQFHRIDIAPLSHWIDTRDLVVSPAESAIPSETAELQRVMPTDDTIQDLHDLCGGSPDELQLYCHHMYRAVERELTQRMELAPGVFQAVMKEFRSVDHSSVNLLDSIENLPRSLLVESSWVRRYGLTFDENVSIEILRRGLQAGVAGEALATDTIRSEIRTGYQTLFSGGITTSETTLELRGGALTRAYWRSYAKSTYDVSFQWADLNYRQSVELCIADALARSCKALAIVRLEPQSRSLPLLQRLRKGHAPPCDSASVVELIRAMKLAGHCGASIFRDVHFVSGADERRTQHSWRLLIKDEKSSHSPDPENWFTSVSPVLEKYGHDAMYQKSETFVPPTPVELFHLTRSSHLPLPQEWNPLTNVSAMFDSGRVSECIALFTELLRFRDDAQLRNNRGFCRLILAQKDAALQDFQASLAIEEAALTRMNESLVLWLNGDQSQAVASLQRAWELAKASGTAFAEEQRLLYAAIAREDGTGVDSHPQMLLGDALCENFVRLGVHSQTSASALRDVYKSKPTAERVEGN